MCWIVLFTTKLNLLFCKLQMYNIPRTILSFILWLTGENSVRLVCKEFSYATRPFIVFDDELPIELSRREWMRSNIYVHSKPWFRTIFNIMSRGYSQQLSDHSPYLGYTSGNNIGFKCRIVLYDGNSMPLMILNTIEGDPVTDYYGLCIPESRARTLSKINNGKLKYTKIKSWYSDARHYIFGHAFLISDDGIEINNGVCQYILDSAMGRRHVIVGPFYVDISSKS